MCRKGNSASFPRENSPAWLQSPGSCCKVFCGHGLTLTCSFMPQPQEVCQSLSKDELLFPSSRCDFSFASNRHTLSMSHQLTRYLGHHLFPSQTREENLFLPHLLLLHRLFHTLSDSLQCTSVKTEIKPVIGKRSGKHSYPQSLEPPSLIQVPLPIEFAIFFLTKFNHFTSRKKKHTQQ